MQHLVKITIATPSPRLTYEIACDLCAKYGLSIEGKLYVEHGFSCLDIIGGLAGPNIALAA